MLLCASFQPNMELLNIPFGFGDRGNVGQHTCYGMQGLCRN